MNGNGLPQGPQGANIPSFDNLNQYEVNRAGDYEGVRQTLYDFQTYPAAGAVNFTFFQVPQGQGGKTLSDTNMETAGTLPAPKHFLIQSIEVFLFPGDLPFNNDATAETPNFTNDVYSVGKAGYLDLFIGSKSYLQEAPLNRFPPKTCLKTEFTASVGATAAAERTLAGDYAVFSGRPYMINPWILLTPTQNFNVKLNFDAAVALPSTVDARIGVVLDGIQYRLSQ